MKINGRKFKFLNISKFSKISLGFERCHLINKSLLKIFKKAIEHFKRMSLSYMRSHQYWVVRHRYSQLLLTCEYCLCATSTNRQSTNMTSQCQFPHVSVTSQINYGDIIMLSQKRPSLPTMAKSVIDNCFGRIVCSGH